MNTLCYYQNLIKKLTKQQDLTNEEFTALLTCEDRAVTDFLTQRARAVREKHYGKDVYIRGLIEFTNHCRNNCYYCGIRRGNDKAQRYRLTREEILSCCEQGYQLGFRTFVLQGGEDAYFTDKRLSELVFAIKNRFPDCAITLSIGEREKESYEAFFAAGAERFLLRHETADQAHYQSLHPAEMSFDHRMQCLNDLRTIGYQVGCGMMIGSPGQTPEHLLKDLRFLQDFQPEMVGIGPFIPQHDTPLAKYPAGTATLTVRLLAIIRLLLPKVLLPATTALGTIDSLGRQKGLLAGANVLMPNLSPTNVRKKYALYDNKICTGEEAAECIRCLTRQVDSTGYHITINRGDSIVFMERKK
ncbi:iron-only hydrogenase maturation protein HydE [Selenomonas ruminantium]|uniref:Iron-only hydrogenase maturation protein HydE n=1 Tax=Selenomonas ruminantium TaxID=971 RepID=A0A1M6SEG9_SELRU|nr:[FeFe] hydrogenase H-cluster radical SAM maturase HydE [Selenomonas ruminantium]SHK42957.1 iron-only hydrogenase maturation protein HydE [Selenomonas ruminantium]